MEFAGPPPIGLVPNEQTWLDVSDLVFIDPVGTGFSRPAEGSEKASGVLRREQESVGRRIHPPLSTAVPAMGLPPNSSPAKATEPPVAAALSSYLLDHDGIGLNGIVLISSVLNFQTLDPADGNDLPYALYLPSYTAIALYHHKLETAEEDLLLNEVQQYALHDYLDALAQGGHHQRAADNVVAHDHYTGLPPELIDGRICESAPTCSASNC